MSENLFSEFSFSNKTAWKIQAEKEIRAPLSSLNPWKIDNSEIIEAYLTLEDLDLTRTEEVQSCQRKLPGWLNITLVDFTNPWSTNSKIKASLTGGAQGIFLNIKGKDLDKCEFSKLLHSVRLSDTPVYLETEQNQNHLFDLISKGAGYYLRGGVAHDPIAHWMRTEKQFNDSLHEIVELTKKTKMMREFHPFMVESHVYHNAGATPVQELGFLIGTMVSYIDMLTDAGISPLQALTGFFFSVSLGPEYLTEIAKLRALRYLYRKVSRAYQLPDELCNPFIHATTSSFFDTELLPHNNILRSTSEAMSAIVGGCNALTIKPYNHTFADSTDSSERIARNISLLISNESYVDHVADPSAGSYFIEKLTLQLADAAWALFLETEQQGGMITSFKKGFVQDKIEKSWKEKLDSLQTGRIIVGVNKYGSNNIPLSPVETLIEDINLPVQLGILPDRNLAQFGIRK